VDHRRGEGAGKVNDAASRGGTEVDGLVPPVVYLPCDSISGDEFEVTTHRMRDGRLALPVYSALDRLLVCCGSQQQWVLMPTRNLDTIGEYVPFDVIVFDVELAGRTVVSHD
jgi:hypothetical protein